MEELKGAGTAQNRKIYGRHGASGPIFGVSYAVLNAVAKKIKVNHPLALELFATGNHDARQLAAKVADPQLLTVKVANTWAKDVDCYTTVGSVAGVIAASRHARSRSDAWRDSPDEWRASTGWSIVGYTAENSNVWTTAELRALLHQIEAEIHARPNRVRHEMNLALINIALRDDSLRREAITAARRIGPVVVDHGQTSCTTPAAEAYIGRVMDHRNRSA